MDEQLRALLSEAVRDGDVKSSDIPAIDLYLDQIISIVTEGVKKGADRYADRVLTKTMINNYSKDGLIQPVKGKKYSCDQILQMLLVYTLKNTLSMSEIRRVLSTVYDKQLPLRDCYDSYLSHKQDDRVRCVGAVEGIINEHEYDVQQDEDYFALLLDLCTLSAYFRAMAQAMLEDRYPDPDEQQRLRAQQEKQEKQQEKQQKELEKQQHRKEAAKQTKAKGQTSTAAGQKEVAPT